MTPDTTVRTGPSGLVLAQTSQCGDCLRRAALACGMSGGPECPFLEAAWEAGTVPAPWSLDSAGVWTCAAYAPMWADEDVAA